MPCICQQPVRPSFKDSYKDLLDKPKLNGVPLDGDVNTDDLHIEYPHLANLPQINGVPLSGNLTPADLGIKAGAQFKVVQQLPITDIDEATVYLVPVQVGQTDNIYQEWIYINNRWEKIGEPISVQGGGSCVESLNKVVDVSLMAEAGVLAMPDFMDRIGLKNNHIYLSHWDVRNSHNYSNSLRFTNCIGVTFLDICSIKDSPNESYVRFTAEGDVFFCGEIQCCDNITYYSGKFIDATDFDHIYATVQ